MPYEELSHTADVAVRVSGETLPGLFAEATRAMFEVMFGALVGPSEIQREVEVEDGSVENLLWGWLSTILGWSEVDRAAYFDAEVSVAPGRVYGRVKGPPLGGMELTGPPIKAVTMHDLEVVQGSEGWSAVVVFDV